MKAPARFPRFLVLLLVIALPTARAATVFTTDTLIGVNDMTYEGQDIVVSNAVLTVDGSHTFNSLRVAAGAMLTHSVSGNGELPLLASVTNELHRLVGTNVVMLMQPAAVIASIIVTDTNGFVAYTNAVDYVITNSGVVFTLERTTNSFIPDGAFVFVSYDYQTVVDVGLHLTLINDLEVGPGASVNADARGFAGGAGLGAGSTGGSPLSGGGGGHGGYGGLSSSNAAGGIAHGQAFGPETPGSGGGAGLGGGGGFGGGAIQIQVGGNCVLNGTVAASGQNATNSRAGGGAGGSIWITAQTISGNGTVRADGGAGEPIHGGGGGGGRIALVASTNLFTGTLSASGGAGWQRGGAGTVFTQDDVAGPKLSIDNGGQSGAVTALDLAGNGSSVVVQGMAHVVNPSNVEQLMTDLIVRAGSKITTTATNAATLNLFVRGDALIEAGAVLSVLGKGATSGGMGTGNSVAGGSGHGGIGGMGQAATTIGMGGLAYGSVVGPMTLGSAGRSIGGFSGGAGGGVVRLTVGGNLKLDGWITADATAATGTLSGGASGGSVWLTLGEFSGSGVISANGGIGGLPYGGGGAGGRIAVTYNSNSFTGTFTAAGGNGAMAGGAGTIYTKLNSAAYADLRVDNLGLRGTNTPLSTSGDYNAYIRGGAILSSGLPALTLGSLEIGSNSSLIIAPIPLSSSITVVSNAIVATGGSISGDGLGFPQGSGSGAGQTSTVGSTGGGHGGYGGRGFGFTNAFQSPGGNVYDQTATPSQAGSRGGGSIVNGGWGGAALRLTVNGTLLLNGRIGVNGANAVTNNAGGGSGGSVWLTLNQFSGSGTISADGGGGHLPNGGGGGGGRIAVYWNRNSFTGTYSAKGGDGFVPGGAGTIYLKANNAPTPSLILDNGGLVGTNTVLDVSPLLNLTLSGGARVMPSLQLGLGGNLSISNLLIGNASILYLTNCTLTLGNTIIASGGAMLADGVSLSQSGSGTSVSSGSSGAGHGGYGGAGAGTAAGGNYYDSISSPTQPGSLGGGVNFAGGRGGGALRLNIAGALVLDGRISANGSNSRSNNGGGGSGGGVWLTANQFSGSGQISADGGDGHLPNGGGGSGGRIAITFNTNAFMGTLSAKGGLGYVGGGAGTIYLRPNNTQLGNLIIDNQGLLGTNTLLTGLTSLSELNLRPGVSVAALLSSLTVNDLNIAAGATLRFSSLTLSVSDSAIIETGGAIVASGGAGPGTGQTLPGGSGGGGHGGYGGRSSGNALGGNIYGSTGNPTQPGSLGGSLNQSGGSSGGALRMTVSGPLVLKGSISANGSSTTTNNAGGGSGGSILLSLNQFSGSGVISADGGSGHLPNGGGGGGGRIAVSWISNAFTGTYSAKGGNGFQAGGAGTIYLKPNSGPSQMPSLVVDNGGQNGTNTVTPDLATLANLTVRGGATYQPAQHLSVASLSIASNSTLLATGFGTARTYLLNISGPTHIAAGGRISADGMGHSSDTGISGGAGGTTRGSGGGGGHGGFGGPGAPIQFGNGAGGGAYDQLAFPAQPGSGGSGFIRSGGSGGGVLRITAIGPFLLDGQISANGLHSVSNSGGGGAGGSVILEATRAPLLGTGRITADGGDGHLPHGGGGGGGRIAVNYSYAASGNQSSNGFLGSFSAKGGNGFVKGGAGTIFVRTNASIAYAIVDNGGVRGTNTLVGGGQFVYDLTVRGGAVATGIGPRDLWVRSNAWVSTIPFLQSSAINVARDATFDAGGGIDLNGLFATGQAGSTFTTPKGGGGHGGRGGYQPANSGNAYGSAITPNSGGSPGGNGSGSTSVGPYGGAGGGLAQLVVGRTMQLDGEISADGRDGEFNSGGGSGGGLRLQALTFAGNGRITANGGNGNGTAGGGGGGRIAIYFTTNLFAGAISACGGNGGEAGGAGTIFVRDNLRSVSSLLLDNCGLAGASTPLSAAIGLATNLFVTGGAVAETQGAIPIFSNLVVTTGGIVTTRGMDTNLVLALQGDLVVGADSGIVVDGKGFALTNGPGAGGSLASEGAGGGHGGAGGASASEAIGGRTYGSPTQPVDRGSGGGMGSGFPASGSEGGGVLRLAVAGTMAIDGVITANGATGVQDDAGGGAGGSIWITAGKLTGQGIIEAAGGDGERYGGGGGGGGRIAVYSPINTFTGLVSVAGGNGAFIGETGTIFTSGNLGSLEVISQTPSGVVSNVVTEILLGFSEPLDPGSVTTDNVVLRTPQETLPPPDWTLSMPTPATLRVSFGAQHVPGEYRIEVGPHLTSLFGTPMSQVYTGSFTVVLPTISGTVTDTNGQPVAGVRLYPSGSLLSAITDATGNYALSVPANWSGAIKPALSGFLFVPGERSYTNLMHSVTNEDYQMVASFAPALQVDGSGSDLRLTWNAFAGVTYQLFVSTNLVDWLPIDAPSAGTNGPMQLVLPVGSEPQKFFRLTAQN